MKQKQCKHIKNDSTICTSFAMSGSDFCYRHNPEIPQEEKLNASSKGGSHSPSLSEMERGFGGEEIISLPFMEMENFQDIVSVMADSINQVRAGKLSQKTGSTIAYMSFIMLMAMEKAKAESRQEKIDKLKAEGKWRPEPKYAPKFYTYKDDFFLDKDGNHLVVEKDGSTFHPRMEFKREDVECRSDGTKSRPGGSSTFHPRMEFKREEDDLNPLSPETGERPGVRSKLPVHCAYNQKKHTCPVFNGKRNKKRISHMNKDEIRQPPLIPPLLRENNVEQNFPLLLKEGTKEDSNDTDDEFVKQTIEVLSKLKEGIEMRKKEEESGP
jgi:hypothetical protein